MGIHCQGGFELKYSYVKEMYHSVPSRRDALSLFSVPNLVVSND